MSKVYKVFDSGGITYFKYKCPCPFCGMTVISLKGKGVPHWELGGSEESPTIKPSVLARYYDDNICHSYIRNGMIEFLRDCTHELAGKTVPMIPLEDEE